MILPNLLENGLLGQIHFSQILYIKNILNKLLHHLFNILNENNKKEMYSLLNLI